MTHHHFDAAHVADKLELEGELSLGLTDQAIALCAERLGTVSRILDLGCGPGVSSARLAEAFPSADVVAVDSSPAMLARAAGRGVTTLQLDLNGDLGALGTCDLAFAAMAIHHADDEGAMLTRFRALLNPGGLLCVLERADPMTITSGESEWVAPTPPTLPGMENAERYASMLEAAGLTVVDSRTLTDTVTAPDDPATRAFVEQRVGPLTAPATVTSSRKLFLAAART